MEAHGGDHGPVVEAVRPERAQVTRPGEASRASSIITPHRSPF